ncbi:hypothetical protein MalM25_10040 [Planctomycetes bacterium MalM25]|nr:hypothetical protein MalM25_10040 [Planctomycetes bacterium MalM25]
MILGQRIDSRLVGTLTLACLVAIGVIGSVGCATVGPGCGCGVGCPIDPGCGCEPSCGCEPDCGCEPGCGCEPACGCAADCGPRGYDYASQKWQGCGDCQPHKPLINVCTGSGCCGGCEPACGCEPGCGCEPSCGCEPACGVGGCGSTCCGGPCGGRCRVGQHLAFGVKSICSEFRCLLAPLGLCNTGCGGCGELYWNEWHSDPPACCDPCDDCGNWVGPSASMQAPYDHAFAPRRVAKLPAADGPVLR